MINNIQKGDLVAYSGYLGKLYVGLYVGEGASVQFWPLTQRTLDRIADKKKPYVEYITGSYTSQRMVKVTPDVLDSEELKVYKEIKGIKDEVTNGS
jgi:hypothetical protein